ncbi:MAG TPA: hypothetical protein VEC93_12865 [Anaerolineae bacterium]|nr:hypothetical protein [Anaerolineae bacterium]
MEATLSVTEKGAAATAAPMTAEELLRLPQLSRRYELIQGAYPARR